MKPQKYAHIIKLAVSDNSEERVKMWTDKLLEEDSENIWKTLHLLRLILGELDYTKYAQMVKDMYPRPNIFDIGAEYKIAHISENGHVWELGHNYNMELIMEFFRTNPNKLREAIVKYEVIR